MTRRQALAVPRPAAGSRIRAQQAGGMASRSVRATPRGRPSGLPFHAHFVNVAHAAGLREPVIYGRRSCRLHSRKHGMRRGIPRLRQRRVARYRDAHRPPHSGNAGRRHDPPLSQQSRRHVYRRDAEIRPRPQRLGRAASPWAITTTTASTISSSPAGARTFCFTTTATERSPT